MASRSLTMTKPVLSTIFRRIFFLLLKIGLVVFLTMTAGWGYGYALLRAALFSNQVHVLVVALMSGAVAGILARFLLYPDGKTVTVMAALIAMLVSQFDLYTLSGGLIGFQIPVSGGMGISWPRFWLIIPGVAVIFLSIFAWRRPVTTRSAPVKKAETEYSSLRPVKKTASRSKFSRRITRFWKSLSIKKLIKPWRIFYKKKLKQASSLFSKMQTRSRSAVRNAAGAIARKRPGPSYHLPVVKFHRARMALQTGSPSSVLPAARRMPKTVHSPIRLVGREEHRCPYCLGVVSSNDPNGVVICPICKTYHHKSCWDVTGECQVPHIHE